MSMMQERTVDQCRTPMQLLIALATRVINEHINEHAHCAACGAVWPCERAVLAEHNLAMF
jgi:hypothetical protein